MLVVNVRAVALAVATVLSCPVLSAESSKWGFLSADEFKQRLERREGILVAYVLISLTSFGSELSSAFLPQWTALQQRSHLAAAVNCTSIPAICREANVSTLPAIRLYQKDGTMVRYRGPRRADEQVPTPNASLNASTPGRMLTTTGVTCSIVSFIDRMSRPVTTELTDENVADFYGIDDIAVMGQFHSHDVALRNSFSDVANRFRDRYSFGMYELPEDDSERPSEVICRNNVDDLEHRVEDFSHVASLENLLESCTAPLVMPLTRRTEFTFNKIAKSPVYYFSDDESDRLAYVDMIRPIAKKFREYLVFATVDTRDYPHMPGMFGLGGGKGLCLQILQNGQIYHFNDPEMSAAQVQRFIEAVSAGEAEPWDARARERTPNHDEL